MKSRQWTGWLTTARLASIAFAIIWLDGCATQPPPFVDKAYDRERLGRIAVVAPQYQPTVQPNQGSAGTGALSGVAGVMTGCVAGGPEGMVACAPLAPLAMIAAVTGAGMTSKNIPSAEILARYDELIRHHAAGLQARLRGEAVAGAKRGGHAVGEVADAGPAAPDRDVDHGALAARGYDTALQVGIAEISSRTSMYGLINLIVTAHVRVIDLHTGRTLLSARYRYASRPHVAGEWLRSDGKAIGEAIEEARRVLAGHAVDETLRLFPIAGMLPTRAEYPTPIVLGRVRFLGLRPIAPERPRQTKIMPPGDWYGAVDTSRPLFRWEPFPRAEDAALDKAGALARVRDVRYELRIAPTLMDIMQTDIPGTRVRVDDLRVPEYRPEQPLEPRTFYRWTVRARFTLDGRERVTPWGQVRGMMVCGRADEAEISANQPNFCSYLILTGRGPDKPARESTPGE